MAYKSRLQQEKGIGLNGMACGADSKILDSCWSDLRHTDALLIFNHIVLSANSDTVPQITL